MKQMNLLSIILVMIVFSSCASSTAPPPAEPLVTAPSATTPEDREPPKPKIALVLGGGAARGFAHIGVIRVLEREKIPVDMIIGTSVGSLIGVIYANDHNCFELEWTAFALKRAPLRLRAPECVYRHGHG